MASGQNDAYPTSLPDGGGANDTVFKAITVNGASYNYLYDALNRRRYKSYPFGTSDEYFYDLGHQMLVDQGNSSTGVGLPPLLDEYIWLGGRVVAIIRGNLTAGWAHQADGVGTCARNDDPNGPACGVYFPVTDFIGRPVLMLEAGGHVVGTGEYDPFGHVNRVFIDAETAHPYGTTNVFGTLSQSSPSPLLKLNLRLLIDVFDLHLQQPAPASCTNQTSASDRLELRDSSGTVISWMDGGHQQTPLTLDVPDLSGGSYQVAVKNLGTCTFPRDASGTCTSSCDGVAAARPESGCVIGAYEFQRHESGFRSFWTPLRFPGQYYDQESDLVENWNRYDDPAAGRYYGVDPILLVPQLIAANVRRGRGSAVYSYGESNPLHFTDPSGMYISVSGGFGGYTFLPGLCVGPGFCKGGETSLEAPWSAVVKCHQQSGCTYGFDIDVQYLISTAIYGSPGRPSPGTGDSILEHENKHIEDLEKGMSAVNAAIKTDGFATKAECESALRAFPATFAKYQEWLFAETGSRDWWSHAK